MRDDIRFVLGDRPRFLRDVAPCTTVLEWLRAERLTGTKEGCAEGDCGACTVALGEPAEGGIRWRPVNACILLLPALDGRVLLTVEHLARDALHPVQRAMVERHASQCGFCTPGIVMSLFALHQEGGGRDEAVEALAGNLCRCTGYRPIVDAAADAARTAPVAHDAAPLAALPTDGLEIRAQGQRHASPRTVAEATALLAERPGALLLAGGTDAALWVTKQQLVLEDVIALDRVAELTRIDIGADSIRIGAAVAYADALPVLEAAWPELGAMLRRLGSRQIRHRGTIGGNLATASPIGDMAPALIALDATVVLASAAGERQVAIDAFFVGYRRTVLEPGELIAAIDIPRARTGDALRVYKVSKRREEDISSVCAAFRLRREGGGVSLRAGLGGVAATPLRATALEQAVQGQPWTEATLALGQAALDASIAPIDDMRASAAYRRLVARNLLRRLFLETTQSGVRMQVAA